MSSDLAKQYHSIQIGNYNTWDSWHLVPLTRPNVAPPIPKTEYVDIPGADGSLDYTEVLSGGINYDDRSGAWQFIVMNGYGSWDERYTTIMKSLQGVYFSRIIFDDDPNYYYSGRLWVNDWKSDKHYSTITINYRLDPYKYPINSTANSDWMWDDLFSNDILYGKFDVFVSKTRTLINNNSTSVSVSTTCTSAMRVTIDGVSTTLPVGTTQNAFTIPSGDTVATFYGYGTITLDYSTGRTL